MLRIVLTVIRFISGAEKGTSEQSSYTTGSIPNVNANTRYSVSADLSKRRKMLPETEEVSTNGVLNLPNCKQLYILPAENSEDFTVIYEWNSNYRINYKFIDHCSQINKSTSFIKFVDQLINKELRMARACGEFKSEVGKKIKLLGEGNLYLIVDEKNNVIRMNKFFERPIYTIIGIWKNKENKCNWVTIVGDFNFEVINDDLKISGGYKWQQELPLLGKYDIYESKSSGENAMKIAEGEPVVDVHAEEFIARIANKIVRNPSSDDLLKNEGVIKFLLSDPIKKFLEESHPVLLKEIMEKRESSKKYIDTHDANLITDGHHN